MTKLEKDNNVNTSNLNTDSTGELQDVCVKNEQNNWEKLISFGMNMPDLKTIKDEIPSQKDVAEFSYRDALKSTTGNCRKIQQQKSVLHDILVSIGLKNNAVLNGSKENTKSDSFKSMEKIESEQFLNGLKGAEDNKSEPSVSFASAVKKWFTSGVKNTEIFEETRPSDQDISLNLVAHDTTKMISNEGEQDIELPYEIFAPGFKINHKSDSYRTHKHDCPKNLTNSVIAKTKSKEMKEKDICRYGEVMNKKSGSIQHMESRKVENTDCIVNRKSLLQVEKKESLKRVYEHKKEQEKDPTNDVRQKIFKEILQIENSMVRQASNESFKVNCNQTEINDRNALILSNDPEDSGRHIILNKRKYEESESCDLSFSFYKEEIKERADRFTTLFPNCCGDSKIVQKVGNEYIDEKLEKISYNSRIGKPMKIMFDSLILDAFTKGNRTSYNEKQTSNSCLKTQVSEIRPIQTRVKSNLSSFHKLISMYQHLVLHKAISHLRMSIFNEKSWPQTTTFNFVSSKEFTRGGKKLKKSADLSLTKCDLDNDYLAVLKDYASLTHAKGEWSQFLKAGILRSVEKKDKQIRFIFKHGIRAAKISDRKENSKLGKSDEDENKKTDFRNIFSSNAYGYQPQFINCQYRSRWYKVLQRIETCVPLAEFLLGFQQIERSFATDDTMHELISSSGKIVFSSKEEHVLGEG